MEPIVANPKPPRRKKRAILMALGLVVLIFICVASIKVMQIRKLIAMKQPVPVDTVTSVVVKQENWAPTLSSVGSISAVQGAVVATELGGVVSQVGFENGGTAKKGDLLIQLDTSSEEAQLHSAEAEAELARANEARSRDLANRKVISKAELDAAEAVFKQKAGTVDNMKAMMSKKTIRAPFDGALGIRQVNVGQMINAGQQVVSLEALDSLYVDFALPQQHLAKLSAGLEVHVTTDAVPGRDFVGKLTAINSAVDAATRNVTLQATLPNEDRALKPGMYAKVEVFLPEKQQLLVVPGTAVSYAPYGDSVFLIEKKKDEKTGQESQVLRQQFVRVGTARGDFVSITNGLKAGDTIVGTGVFKLRNGGLVTVNNDLAPKPQLAPSPPDT